MKANTKWAGLYSVDLDVPKREFTSSWIFFLANLKVIFIDESSKFEFSNWAKKYS